MTRFVQIVTDRWRRNGMIAESDIEIYDYGLQLVLFTLFNLTVILTIAEYSFIGISMALGIVISAFSMIVAQVKRIYSEVNQSCDTTCKKRREW